MARVTIENCLKKESNRFKLVAAATKRVLELREKAPVLIDNTAKNSMAIVALREIAAGKIVIKKQAEV